MSTIITISDNFLINKIYSFRGYKVMLDSDLSELYDVETKVLKQAVKRNIDIFPEHFMFELTEQEFQSLRSQIVTSKIGRGGTRYMPMVFTEHGVLQLANVLRSLKAKQIGIRIIEVFVRLRQAISENTELKLAIQDIKKKTENNTKNIELVFHYLDELLEKNEKPQIRNPIGYQLPKQNK